MTLFQTLASIPISILYYGFLATLTTFAIVALLHATAMFGIFKHGSFYARVLLSLFALIICAIYGCWASIVLTILGEPGLSQWTTARAFKYTMKFLLDVEFVMENEEYLQERPCVILGNHQTELDVLMLGEVFPRYTSVTAKKQLKWTPFLGWFMALSNTVFIDRSNPTSARSTFASAAQTMRSQRQNVFIFPEGTRSYAATPTMLPLKKGAFHLAVQAQVPIVPVVVANYSNILHLQTKRFVKGQIPIKVLKPIATEGLGPEDVDRLASVVRGDMERELVGVTEKARRMGVAGEEAGAAVASGGEKGGSSGVRNRARVAN